MRKISTIYVKELEDIDELIDDKKIMPLWIKKIIYLVRKIFCLIKIDKNNICILPYKELKNKYLIEIIIDKLLRKNKTIILSKKLKTNKLFMEKFKSVKKEKIESKELCNHLMINILNYVCTLLNLELCTQDVTILVKNLTLDNKKIIMNIANLSKRISIVTNNITNFGQLEKELNEKYGIAILISNNRKKSILKSRIILNLDFNEKDINKYNMNPKAVIINIKEKANIYAKYFEGINILNYEISFDYYKINCPYQLYEKFDRKEVYESFLAPLNNKKIVESNLNIINLIGKNGIIQKQEFTKHKFN